MATEKHQQDPPPEQYLPTATGSRGGAGPARSTIDEYTGRKRKLIYPPAPEPAPVPVVDNHAHLDFRDGLVQVTPTQAMDAAGAVNVVGAIQVATDLNSAKYTIDAIEQEPRLRGALAIHPNDTVPLYEAGELDAAIDTIKRLAEHPQIVSIGETGLDYYRTEGQANWEIQQYAFKRHIDLAVELGLALQIHDRQAHEDVVATLLSMDQLPEYVVFHSFSGDAELAKILNQHGWYASFSGVVTFKNNHTSRQLHSRCTSIYCWLKQTPHSSRRTRIEVDLMRRI